jgi:hypothetical protein
MNGKSSQALRELEEGVERQSHGEVEPRFEDRDRSRLDCWRRRSPALGSVLDN